MKHSVFQANIAISSLALDSLYYVPVYARHTVFYLSVIKATDSIASRFEAMEASYRFPPVNMASSRFHLPSIRSAVPLISYWPYHGGYVNPDMPHAFTHQGKDMTVLSGYMGHCYHPAFQCIPNQRTDEEKPTQSYIGLIGKAILSSPQQKLVLGDIYNFILTNYPYFRNKGPGWRNSIRHNLSLNDCFVKLGRSPNGKGHFWAINPRNYEDFSRGEYKRKRAPRRSRKNREDVEIKASENGNNYSTFEMHCANGSAIQGGMENRGFHIETLLSSDPQNKTSAFTVVSQGLSCTKQELGQKTLHQESLPLKCLDGDVN